MAIFLTNTTNEEIRLKSANLRIAAGQTLSVKGSDKPMLRQSTQLVTLIQTNAVTVSNLDGPLPTQQALSFIYNNQINIDSLKEFSTEVASKGIPTYNSEIIAGFLSAITTSFRDISSMTSNLILPTTIEVYYIFSSSAEDSAAGTGARTVEVVSLDANGLTQSTFVTMNGTTPVYLTGSHMFPKSITVRSSGSNQSNVGSITLRADGNNQVRGYIEANTGASLSTVIMVPFNREFLPTTLSYHTGATAKEIDIRIQHMVRGTNTWVTSAILPFLQQAYTITFKATQAYPAGTIFRIQAKAVVGGAGGSVAASASGYFKEHVLLEV